ncbi:hypothetical protein GmHk_11G032488 [Glycine max]|nr:hypothetical protein GmHk_11G032488 [Glycine max]
MNPNVGRPYGRNRRVNNGPNRIERQDKIERVKLNVPPFKGKSDPDTYLDWEMKIQHAFSYNDYPEEQKVKLAAATFSDYALVWLSQGSLIVEEYYNEMEMALVRANIEEDTKAVHDGFTNKISFQDHDQKIILKPLSLREEFKDAFPKEIPHGLPPSRSIVHQVDLLPKASLPNRPTYNSKPQETQHKDAQAKVEYVKRLYDQVKVQVAKKNESYAKQANKKRKEVVLEPGDDPGHLRANVFQEGGNDENPKIVQIQGLMTGVRLNSQWIPSNKW